jgi:hypothetical protein
MLQGGAAQAPPTTAIDQIFTPSGENSTIERFSGSLPQLRSSTLTMSYRIRTFPVLAWILSVCLAPSAGAENHGRDLRPESATEAGSRPVALPTVVGAADIYASDTASGLALGGFDPVTYFLPQGPQPGRAGLETLWGGVAWRFSSEANLAAFKANPAAYAPRVGGYDAQAAALGRVVDSRPDIYLVRNDRLYLFRTDAGRARFLADPTLAARSEEAWLTLRAGLVRP